MLKLTWLSHASWLIETQSHTIVLDPFFDGNPAAKHTAADFNTATHVLVSHGHADHVGDVAGVVQASGAKLITNYEIAEWFKQNHGIDNAVGMNIGGTVSLDDNGSVKMVPAIHSSSMPDGSYGGTAAGFILHDGGRRVYFACDTAYFSDMKFYAGGVDVAVVPIGDLFTMGVKDSLEAIKLTDPKKALPTHYDTWPMIKQDAAAWARAVRNQTDTEPVVLAVGEALEL